MKEVKELWNPELEKQFLEKTDAIKYAVIRCQECNYSYQAFFRKKKPKSCPKCNKKLRSNTPQGRNSPVANYTEKYALNLINTILINRNYNNLIAKRDIICNKLGLTSRSGADIAIINNKNNKNKRKYKAKDIKMIFEIKMSIVWNWLPGPKLDSDYDGHKGRGSIYRTDSILKAIGKGAIFRSHYLSHNIPYIVIGNCPPPSSYQEKIDGAKNSGIVQGFISVNSNPLIINEKKQESRNIKSTEHNGYLRVDSIKEFGNYICDFLKIDRIYIGKMISKKKLGNIISSLTMSKSPYKIGEEFFSKLHNKEAF